MTDELCPFCGKEDPSLYVEQDYVGEWIAYLTCQSCGAELKAVGDTETEAVNAVYGKWNARAAVTDGQFAMAVHNGEAWQRVHECRWEAVTNPRGEVTEFMGECGCCMGYVPNFCPKCGGKVVE